MEKLCVLTLWERSLSKASAYGCRFKLEVKLDGPYSLVPLFWLLEDMALGVLLLSSELYLLMVSVSVKTTRAVRGWGCT